MTTVGNFTDAEQLVSKRRAILELDGIDAGYGRTKVLRDINIAVRPGEIVALLGPNGAGKTTLLRTAAGLLKPSAGRIRLAGRDVTSQAPNRRAKSGLCLIPEGRGIFRGLTVRDNLRLQVPAAAKDKSVDRAIDAFPVLAGRLGQIAGSLSGGQQQMLALSRCFLSAPAIVLLDEVSMGLAPKIVDEIFASIRCLASGGTALLLVEQYISRAIDMADNVVLLDRGQIVFSAPPSSVQEDVLLRGYLGVDITSTVPALNDPHPLTDG